jgi:hypothetical protein
MMRQRELDHPNNRTKLPPLRPIAKDESGRTPRPQIPPQAGKPAAPAHHKPK